MDGLSNLDPWDLPCVLNHHTKIRAHLAEDTDANRAPVLGADVFAERVRVITYPEKFSIVVH